MRVGQGFPGNISVQLFSPNQISFLQKNKIYTCRRFYSKKTDSPGLKNNKNTVKFFEDFKCQYLIDSAVQHVRLLWKKRLLHSLCF